VSLKYSVSRSDCKDTLHGQTRSQGREQIENRRRTQ
jgi:hypothetical protein